MLKNIKSATVRAFALGLMVGTLVIGTAVVARADIDLIEADYADRWGHRICAVLDADTTENSLWGIAAVIMGDGHSAAAAADIVNASVATQCPRNWPFLVAVGNKYSATAVA